MDVQAELIRAGTRDALCKVLRKILAQARKAGLTRPEAEAILYRAYREPAKPEDNPGPDY